jgi:membrane protease YdiL (CAAX protease family)
MECISVDSKWIRKEGMMIAKRDFIKDIVRPIGVSWVAIAFGSLLALILEMFLDLEVPTLVASGITFVFAVFVAFYLFPQTLKSPFGDLDLSTYLHRLGFYLPQNAWKHILLGTVLAICTLSGMLIGSLLTGRYELDWSTVDLNHILFSINPGIWEEFFFRGVILLLLLRVTGSIRQAALIQMVLFGLTHIKGTDLAAWADVLTVMILAVGFTYTAYKTRTLIAGIVFHFLHDAFLFLPQVPGVELFGISEYIAFNGSLWIMVGVGCLLTKIASDRLGVKAEDELYSFRKISTE